MDYGHWDISLVGEFDPAEWHGFIYEIEHIASGKLYIGKKSLRYKGPKTKKSKNRMRDSKWVDYTSSSETVNELITEEGMGAFAFRIIKLCSGKCELNYEEESIQRERDVLRARLPNGERAYFNRTIGYKNFGGLEKQSEASNAKRRAKMLGNTYATAHKGRVLSEEWKAKLSEAASARIRTPEENEKRSATMSKLRWWNDGIQNARQEECPGEGWVAGRLPFPFVKDP